MRFQKAFSATLVSAALCFSSTNAVAASCQAGGAGCLLPFQAAPVVAPPVAPAAPVTPIAAEPIVEAGGGGIGLVPILLGLVALGVIGFLLLDDDEDSISV